MEQDIYAHTGVCSGGKDISLSLRVTPRKNNVFDFAIYTKRDKMDQTFLLRNISKKDIFSIMGQMIELLSLMEE